ADLRPRVANRPAKPGEIQLRLERAERNLADLEARLASRGWFRLGSGQGARAGEVPTIYRRMCLELACARGLIHHTRNATTEARPSRVAELQSRYETTVGRSEERRQHRIDRAGRRRDALREKARWFLEQRRARIRAEAESSPEFERRLAELVRAHH